MCRYYRDQAFRLSIHHRASGEGHGARGDDFLSETRLFPLAPSPVPLARPVGKILQRTVMNIIDPAFDDDYSSITSMDV